jgi:UDP-3-O-[3-hydroxymyristoyl] glucosamine N-acyltransferase
VPLRLSAIVEALGGELIGDSQTQILALAPLETATSSELSFLSHPKYAPLLAASKAGCVIVSPAMQSAGAARGACIVADDPYLYFAHLTQLWKRSHNTAAATTARVHPSAVVDPNAHVDASAIIGPLCVVEAGASVGANTVLKSRVTISENCVVGARCILHSGVVIGADGFGFAPNQGAWEKIEQLGAVRQHLC